MADLDEYGRDEGTILDVMPRPFRLPSGRLAMTMTKLAELAGKDTRMGRGQPS
ncbi:MAG: hypothetical protein H0U67_16770 [Gemmatimonadetes bacterium]|nr:hypothetical protein [Gemmatimonadota bacterium]